jgi:hypothetical protein
MFAERLADATTPRIRRRVVRQIMHSRYQAASRDRPHISETGEVHVGSEHLDQARPGLWFLGGHRNGGQRNQFEFDSSPGSHGGTTEPAIIHLTPIEPRPDDDGIRHARVSA